MKRGSGWHNESQRHRMASMGYKTCDSKFTSRGNNEDTCSKPLDVYKGINVREDKPLDLRTIRTADYWSLDSRVAKLFSANPKNSMLTDPNVVRAIEREYWGIIDNMGIDPNTNPAWLEIWLSDVANHGVAMMDDEKYGIILRSKITRGDDVERGGSEYTLEREAFVKNPIDIIEIGLVDVDNEEPLWIDYDEIPEEMSADSNKFRSFMYKKGESKEIDDKIPTGIYFSFIHNNFDIPYPEWEEKIKEGYYDLNIEGHDFWELECDVLPKYEGIGESFKKEYQEYLDRVSKYTEIQSRYDDEGNLR